MSVKDWEIFDFFGLKTHIFDGCWTLSLLTSHPRGQDKDTEVQRDVIHMIREEWVE